MNAHIQNTRTVSAGTVAALIAWWNNNSFTQAALAADEVYEQKKNSVH